MPRGFRGTGEVTTSFSIPENSLEYWVNDLKIKGLVITDRIRVDDYTHEQVITFYDPDGMELELSHINLQTK